MSISLAAKANASMAHGSRFCRNTALHFFSYIPSLHLPIVHPVLCKTDRQKWKFILGLQQIANGKQCNWVTDTLFLSSEMPVSQQYKRPTLPQHHTRLALPGTYPWHSSFWVRIINLECLTYLCPNIWRKASHTHGSLRKMFLGTNYRFGYKSQLTMSGFLFSTYYLGGTRQRSVHHYIL